MFAYINNQEFTVSAYQGTATIQALQIQGPEGSDILTLFDDVRVFSAGGTSFMFQTRRLLPIVIDLPNEARIYNYVEEFCYAPGQPNHVGRIRLKNEIDNFSGTHPLRVQLHGDALAELERRVLPANITHVTSSEVYPESGLWARLDFSGHTVKDLYEPQHLSDGDSFILEIEPNANDHRVTFGGSDYYLQIFGGATITASPEDALQFEGLAVFRRVITDESSGYVVIVHPHVGEIIKSPPM